MQHSRSITAFFPAYNDGGTIPSMVLTALLTLRQVTDDYEIIVANDGENAEGSYGTDSHGNERPEDPLDPLCFFTQDLTRSCD